MDADERGEGTGIELGVIAFTPEKAVDFIGVHPPLSAVKRC